MQIWRNYNYYKGPKKIIGKKRGSEIVHQYGLGSRNELKREKKTSNDTKTTYQPTLGFRKTQDAGGHEKATKKATQRTQWDLTYCVLRNVTY